MKKWLLLGSVMLFVTGCKGGPTSAPKGFSKYLESLGYSFYNPPRTDMGAGSLFRLESTESGIVGVSPVCSKLYPNMVPNESDVTIPDESSKEKFDVAFSVQLVSDLLKDLGSVSAALARDEKIEIKFGGFKSFHLFEEDLLNEDGTAREITPRCYGRLQQLKATGKLDGVFIVQDALRVDSATYSLVRNTDSTVEAEVSLSKALDLKPNVEYTVISQRALNINEPRYVAFKAFKLTEYTDTGLTTAGSVIIKAIPMDIEQFK